MTHFSLNQCLRINVLLLGCQVYTAGDTQIVLFWGGFFMVRNAFVPTFRRNMLSLSLSEYFSAHLN